MTALPAATREARSLTENEMQQAMQVIMAGEASHDEIAAFLTDLAQRGETADEIVGAARVLRGKAASIRAPDDALDCCGTGGDGIGTYNISTAVALVAAACGVPVAKHGNRAASSKSGAADVLEALGVNLDASHEVVEKALNELGFCFLMAPRHHQAMKHVVPVRKALGFRTIFNLLGPLANPAGTQYQLIGVFDSKWLVPMATALDRLGTNKALLVHGSDGLDEITTTGPTEIVTLDGGDIDVMTVTPADFGLPVSNPDDLLGGTAEENAAALKDLLDGRPSAYRDIVLANTAAALNVHGTAGNLKEGVTLAAAAIDEGRAAKVLEDYKNFVRGSA